jgi:hypothetical protein
VGAARPTIESFSLPPRLAPLGKNSSQASAGGRQARGPYFLHQLRPRLLRAGGYAVLKGLMVGGAALSGVRTDGTLPDPSMRATLNNLAR